MMSQPPVWPAHRCEPAPGGEGVHGESHSGFAAVAGYSRGRGAAGWFEGDVVVKGDLRLEGADYAEALTTVDPDVVPGSVVVIGHNGEVHQCNKEYDPAVAGIVSGARGIKPPWCWTLV
jgi:hypothetical protein